MHVLNNSGTLVPTSLPSSTVGQPIKMEVGIEDCLHIEFEYNKSKYHLKVCKQLFYLGKIVYFLLLVFVRTLLELCTAYTST